MSAPQTTLVELPNPFYGLRSPERTNAKQPDFLTEDDVLGSAKIHFAAVQWHALGAFLRSAEHFRPGEHTSMPQLRKLPFAQGNQLLRAIWPGIFAMSTQAQERILGKIDRRMKENPHFFIDPPAIVWFTLPGGANNDDGGDALSSADASPTSSTFADAVVNDGAAADTTAEVTHPARPSLPGSFISGISNNLNLNNSLEGNNSPTASAGPAPPVPAPSPSTSSAPPSTDPTSLAHGLAGRGFAPITTTTTTTSTGTNTTGASPRTSPKSQGKGKMNDPAAAQSKPNDDVLTFMRALRDQIEAHDVDGDTLGAVHDDLEAVFESLRIKEEADEIL